RNKQMNRRVRDSGADATNNRAAVLGIRLLRLLARTLPPRIFLGACAAAGSIAGMVSKRESRIAASQIAFAFAGCKNAFHTDKQCRALARASFRHIGRFAGECLLIDRLLGEQPSNAPYITVSGQDIVEEILHSGQGALALSGHFGCFELQPPYFAGLGIPATVIARSPNYGWLAAAVNDLRSYNGVELLWRGKEHSVKTLYRALKQQRIICTLLDQDVNLDNHFAPFFGEGAASPVVPLRIALAHKLPVVTSFIIRKDVLHHHIVIERVPYDGSDPQALEYVLNCYNQRLEALIRQYPEQWLWWHRRWRRRPGIDYEAHPELLRSTNDYLAWLVERTAERVAA
ncbi:MAG TPA: lysophospholipid acyltransferase family protein, partial [Oligoflexia bacterium]|nr:lysophospholipid acyltransferase family protein [Oligoflexia bacterium]